MFFFVIVGFSHGVSRNDINSWRLRTRKKRKKALCLPFVGGNSRQRFGMIRLFVSWWSRILYSADVALAVSLIQRVRVARIDRPFIKAGWCSCRRMGGNARCEITPRIAQSWEARQRTNLKQKHRRRRNPKRWKRGFRDAQCLDSVTCLAISVYAFGTLAAIIWLVERFHSS